MDKTINITQSKFNCCNKGIILAIYIALKPIYLFSSGTLQICDYFLLIGVMYLFITYKGVIRFPAGANTILKIMGIVLVYQIIINSIWTVFTGTSMMKPILYYLFNFIVFFVCLVIYNEIGIEMVKRNILTGCFFASIILIFSLLILVLEKAKEQIVSVFSGRVKVS